MKNIELRGEVKCVDKGDQKHLRGLHQHKLFQNILLLFRMPLLPPHDLHNGMLYRTQPQYALPFARFIKELRWEDILHQCT